MECTLYCRSFKGIDAGSIARFITETFSLQKPDGSRPVFVVKSRGDRQAKIRFDVNAVKEPQLQGIDKLVFREEAVKFDGFKCEEALDEDGEQKMKKKKTRTETIEQLCLPWLDLDYSEQLERKQGFVKDALDSALAGVRKAAKTRSYRDQIEWGRLEIEATIFLKNTHDGYRNKCEFTFAPNAQGIPDIGFMHARATMRSEPIVCAGEHLMHVPSSIAEIVVKLRSLLRENIDSFPLFSHVKKTGVWRLAAIRVCPFSGQSQVLIQSGKMEDAAMRENFEEKLIQFAKNQNITSLFVQYNGSLTDTTVLSELHVMQHLFGSESIEMRIATSDDRFAKFKVHPLSFFQTNSAGCALLYSRVASLVELKRSEIILDVCCGVGTIGQFIASQASGVEKIFGVDIVEQAIVNAKENAELNNLCNVCEYVAGRAEVVVPSLIQGSAVGGVAIVDPPRVGLHKSVINALRENDAIKTIVYVSCNPASLALDLVKFCEPLTSCAEEEGLAVNKRFEPVSAVAVDMFPNTAHCEVVVLLTR